MFSRILSASSSEVILGVFFVLAYAGDNNALTADLPDDIQLQNYIWVAELGVKRTSLTFEIVNSFTTQHAHSILESRFTAAEKVNDISHVLRSLYLQLLGRHGGGGFA